ncbi:MAG: helix-turn-helix transcriptional regulator [Chloroflexota bacterium]|nr:helix-turn-helix transcriptional regulator [Chloroflexota bacterium]
MIKLKIREVAKAKGFSMGKLSRASDVSYRTIKLIYADPYRSIETYTLDKLATALGVKAEELIETVDNKQPEN